MSALHVTVRPSPGDSGSQLLGSLYGFVDFVVDGVNITARVGRAQVSAFLAELGLVVSSLTSGRRRRGTVQLFSEEGSWELGLELDGSDVLLTLLHTGLSPEVPVFERRVTLTALRSALLATLRDAPREGAPESLRGALRSAELTLRQAPFATPEARQLKSVKLKTERVDGVGFSAEVRLRLVTTVAAPVPLERADIHALLFPGEVALTLGKKRVVLEPVQVFLFAERLLLLADELVESWRVGRPLFRRVQLGDARLALRREAEDGPVTLTVSTAELRGRPGALHFPQVPALGFAAAAAQLQVQLCEAIRSVDASQGANLRWKAARELAESVIERVRILRDGNDSLTNPNPQSYRPFASQRPDESQGAWTRGGRMRFLPKWVATVPNVDLQGTFLCGDRLITSSPRETAAIDRESGALLWQVNTSPAITVATPSGLARFLPEGRVVLHDYGTGEVRFQTPLTPRSSGGATGAVVAAPGLPKLLVASEGERKITAIDLSTGEIRWRHSALRAGAYRIRQAGRLLFVAGGDSALVALDAVTGEVVWRLRRRFPIWGEMTVDGDWVYALCGSPRGHSTLLAINAWTGELLFEAALDEPHVPGQSPMCSGNMVLVPVREREGVALRAVEREVGERTWSLPSGSLGRSAQWLAAEDLVIANGSSGSLLAIEGSSGKVRYHHVFAQEASGEAPRRLELTLRSGALFVPQQQVHVLRPQDGELIGSVPTDLIPDLVRVDDQCGVYVVEESGHLAAFGAAPRLALVR